MCFNQFLIKNVRIHANFTLIGQLFQKIKKSTCRSTEIKKTFVYRHLVTKFKWTTLINS